MVQDITFAEIKVGDKASMSKTVTEFDVYTFAGVTGDFNPVHIDAEFAKTTMFKGRIAHGMLSAGIISAAIAGRLPGPGTIYLSQNLKFKAPVRPGDTVKCTLTVTDVMTEKRRVALSTVCTVGETVVIDGDAVVMPTNKASRG